MDYSKAYELKQEGLSLRDIMDKLNIKVPYKSFQRALLRYEYKQGKEQVQEQAHDIKTDLLKTLSKEQTMGTLSKQFNASERVIQAYIEDIKEEGYLITEINGKIKLANNIMPTDNHHSEIWTGEKIIRFGVTSDNHLCSKWQQITFLNHLYDIFQSEGIETVYNPGDITEGYKMRPGHEFEIFKFGADEQTQYVIDNYPSRKGITTKFITGNHDHSHIKNGGIDIGKRITRDRQDMTYLGMSNAKVNITPNCIVELNHPLDGAAYALSYAPQKTIDAMYGGEKPNILLNGHHHKMFYMFYRNIHAYECGTTQAQTPWMRGKRLAANTGGLIIEVHVSEDGTITRCKGEYIPLYKTIENDY